MGTESLDQLRDELAATLAKEQSIRMSLESYVRRTSSAAGDAPSEHELLTQQTKTLLQFKQQGGIETLRRQTAQVGAAIVSANDVAEKMTREVRKLGKIQERLKATVERSDCMLRIRQSMQRLKASMTEKNYMDAAACLKELRAIEAMHIPLDVSDTLRMNHAENDIRFAIENQLDAALHNKDTRELLRVGSIFEPMQFAEEGVLMVLKFIQTQLQTQLDAIVGPPNAVWSVSELTTQLVQVFNCVAETTTFYEPLLVQSFQAVHGAERMLTAVYLQGTPPAVSILTAYGKQRGLASLLAKARALAKPAPPSQQQPSTTQPPSPSKLSTSSSFNDELDLHPYLNELVMMIQHSQTFERFMRGRQTHYFAHSPATSPRHGTATTNHNTTTALPSYNASALNQCVQDLAGYYCSLEEQSLLYAAKKALALEEMRSVVLEGDQLVPLSSIVDEIFYVARLSGARALATGHVDSACGVLNVIATLVQATVGDVFKSRVQNVLKDSTGVFGGAALGLLATLNPKQLRDHMANQLQATLGKKVPGGYLSSPPTSNPRTSTTNAAIATQPKGASGATGMTLVLAPPVTMNSLDAIVQYLAQLQASFEQEVATTFPNHPPRMTSCLLGLEETASEYKALLSTYHDTVIQSMFQPKVASTVAPLFKRISYDLTEVQFTANEANDPFVHALVQAVATWVEPFEAHLSRTNFATLMEGAADVVVDTVSAMVWTKSFNQLGALQLEKEVRVLAGYFGAKCHHSTRHDQTFASLRQTVLVLTVDSLDDIVDVVGRPTKGVEWKVPKERVTDLLHLRVEFSTAAVAAMKV
ncbi:hypothetical protein H310_02989 [Aphanomyces invadans]|uniref:Conserved oligomeric Golgi complex subunit 4 n=1 Tax=Aphanomyces invadans TaxID=157072 RepID=A0A024UK99_9STRA|nr:hypothetical protein H310_02989 [Aphanomyces invadans]ETW06856.1 hypothetical protein H310_02989 [Aphanomyces invadans]|eukprot:XP_008864931.1 hypothetical protein H310_02989 [Aphanomyces invadans]